MTRCQRAACKRRDAEVEMLAALLRVRDDDNEAALSGAQRIPAGTRASVDRAISMARGVEEES